MKKQIVAFATISVIALSLFSFSLQVNAQGADSMFWNNQEGNVQSGTGLGNADPRTMAARVINILLGFMGIIAVIIILLGGFRWMTAAGNEDKVAEAKRIIGSGAIGLIIVLMAFGLAQFVLNAMYNATGATG